MPKIAFLFLVYDKINNERLWHNFFRKVEHDRYSVYIHWKHKGRLQYFEQNKLRKPVPTAYADLSLVKAQNRLLREALQERENKRFVFLSNACIPLKSFDQVYGSLYSNEYCYFNAAPDEHIFERNRGDNIAAAFGREHVRKASQWSVLTRPIAEVLSTSDNVLEQIFDPGARDLADEYFYLSYLSYLGKLQYLRLSDYSATECTTFEFWEDKDYPFRESFTSAHPDNWDRRLKTYADIREEELHYLLGAPCLFGRKFADNCTVDNKVPITDSITRYYKL